MTKNDLKNGLANVHDRLAELETQARKLQNQNFADIVAGAKGRVQQLLEHPDLENVVDGDVQQEGLPFDPAAGKPAPDFTPKYDPAVRPVPGSDFPAQQQPAPLTTGVVAPAAGEPAYDPTASLTPATEPQPAPVVEPQPAPEVVHQG